MKNNTPSKRNGKSSRGPAAEVSAEKRHELIKLGVDTHAGSYTFARMIDNLGIQPPQKMSPEAFIEFLKKQLTLARRVVMVYEAGPYGFSLYRQVTAMGVECVVFAPERLSRGRKRVNDKIDARELLNRLDRHLAGNDAALRLVHPPTIEQEIRRRQARERNTYRKERQRWIGRGRSALHTLGIARPGRWWEPQRYTELMQQVQARLCPGEDSSGDSQMSLSIEKHGNPRIRAVLVECAWLLPRFQKKYIRLKRWQWVFEEGSKAGKAMRKKAAVALARQLAVDLWRLRTGRAKAQDLGLELAAA